MIRMRWLSWLGLACLGLSCLGLISACAILPGGKPQSRSTVYLLEARVDVAHADVAHAEGGCQVVVVNQPQTAPGLFGAHMLYQRHPNQIEHFAFSRWAASPAAMIEPLLLDVLRSGQRFAAVLSSPAPVRADLRIDNDALWLIQTFEADSSFIELRMASRVYSPQQRRLLASEQFSYTESAARATPAAGVAAAERAVERLLGDYHRFVQDAAGKLGQNCINPD